MIPRPHLLVLGSALLFGTTGTAQELGAEGASPLTVGAARVAVGGALLVAAAAALGELRGASPSRRAVLIGALGVAGYQLGFFAAVRTTGVAIGTIVAIGSAPAFTGLADALRGERPGRAWLAATLLAVAGCTLLVLQGGGGGVEPAGVALALAAGASYAAYTVTSKELLRAGLGPVGVMAYAFGLGALLLLPVLALGDAGWVGEPDGAATALYLGVVPTALAYVLFARGLRGLAAATVATLTLAEPVFATALGVVVLGERPTATAALGAALVLSGLVLATRGAPEERTAAAAL